MSTLLDESNEFVSRTVKSLALADGKTSAKVFEECEFKDCNFSAALFSKCKFVDCTFVNCNLSNAKVIESKFLNVEFSQCKVIGINWTEAAWPRIAVDPQLTFRNSILNDSSFFGLKLHEIVIHDCKAHGVDFRGADMTRANLTHTDLQRSLFGKTTLTEADFAEATNYSIDVLDNSVDKARFSRHEAFGLLSGLDIELID
jgi:fluoroquinolone resistance protein